MHGIPYSRSEFDGSLAKNYFLKAIADSTVQRKVKANSFSTLDETVVCKIKMETIYSEINSLH